MESLSKLKEVTIYTDGACTNNPGVGGYGAILIYSNSEKEISGGYRYTTNNRMELMSVITALQALKSSCSVKIYSDSRYVIDGIEKGWAKNWKLKNWRKSTGEKALNPDLWEELLKLCSQHQVKFEWVKGHSGNPLNERADQLAVKAAKGKDLLIDFVYETSINNTNK